MTKLTWDQVGERDYETGVDRGVLYLPNNGGNYTQRLRLERSDDRHRVAFGRRGQPAVRRQHQVPEPRLRGGVRCHDRGVHLPGRVRAVRWHG